MSEIVFDTYALIEIIKGNRAFYPYVAEIPIINHFVLVELCYWVLKEYGKEKASTYTDYYSGFVHSIDKELVKEACWFRLKNRSKNLSFTDCISFMQAKKLGLKFLTGDKQFKGLLGVEFVK